MPNLNVGLALAISTNASIPSTAMAAGCLAAACTTQIIYAAQGMNCATSTTNCYGDYKVLTCNSCNSGYTRTQQTTSVSGCDNSVTFYTCISNSSSGGDEEDDDCDGTCTDCTSTDWTSVATGYEKNQLQPATPAHVYVPAAQPTDVPPTITAAVAAPFYAN